MIYKDSEYIDKVNKTYSKTFSKRQMLPDILGERYTVKSDLSVLDYGSGKDAIGTQKLKRYFFDVTSYDIGENFNSKYHDPDALDRTYDLIMVSNVINIQPDIDCVEKVLDEVRSRLSSTGMAYINYPKSPRKCDELTNAMLYNILTKMFETVVYEMISGIYCVRK